ncbi:hypothetical protein [Paenibacillus validus]|uniref:Uncharacterized protein n=1 Tax=Paenibacillus validus TaxID=44253 RepID=A0A7X2Z7G0_9BACL|nr:hypothetical protein [Paenibacillus validus]MUG69140.1 hypothetical protein [Paenibacillus validus]
MSRFLVEQPDLGTNSASQFRYFLWISFSGAKGSAQAAVSRRSVWSPARSGVTGFVRGLANGRLRQAA